MTVAIVKPDAEFVIVGMENGFITEQPRLLRRQWYHVKIGQFGTMDSRRMSFQGKRDCKNPGWDRLVGLAVWVSKCLDPVCPAADLERQR
ncbi:MAG: hypothetical protein LBF88_09935 [Planctomycetaceae bacterium]|jgi:hypothetical protein|nr:hypothetical protein [Planctomycetaceae bacterium]